MLGPPRWQPARAVHGPRPRAPRQRRTEKDLGKPPTGWGTHACQVAITMTQSAPLVAHGGYGPPWGVGTLSWVGVGHGVAFGRVFGAVGGVRGVKVGQGGTRVRVLTPGTLEPLDLPVT